MRLSLSGIAMGLAALLPLTAAAQDEQVLEEKLRAAEARLQAAAEEVARLSDGMHSRVIINTEGKRLERALSQDRPRIGVALSSTRVDGKRDGEGVEILSVSPGSAAAEGGVKARDRLISVGQTSLTEADASEASIQIIKALDGKAVGDSITVKVLRDDEPRELTLKLNEQSFSPSVNSFRFGFGDGGVLTEEHIFGGNLLSELQGVDNDFEVFVADGGQRFNFIGADSGWGSMELVELSEDLGRYFGTDSGLLVVSAPSDESLGFVDGDVIQDIGGRVPKNVGHAMRILRSYTAGESLKVKVLRDKRSRTLDVTVPERSSRHPFEKMRGMRLFDDSPAITWLEEQPNEVVVIEEGRTTL
ncbi:MAG: PDZ domain-containing protein [Pseudomonadota bacterium]